MQYLTNATIEQPRLPPKLANQLLKVIQVKFSKSRAHTNTEIINMYMRLSKAYEICKKKGSEVDFFVIRDCESSKNPRIARILEIYLQHCIDFDYADVLAICRLSCLATCRRTRRLVKLISIIPKPIGLDLDLNHKERLIVFCFILDNLRHLHMTTISDRTRNNILTNNYKTIQNNMVEFPTKLDLKILKAINNLQK